jgi:hypothetical protein
LEAITVIHLQAWARKKEGTNEKVNERHTKTKNECKHLAKGRSNDEERKQKTKKDAGKQFAADKTNQTRATPLRQVA